MTFDAWYRKHWDLGINIEAIAKSAWNAAIEEFKRNPPEGLYRIGEEVVLKGLGEVIDEIADKSIDKENGWISAKIGLCENGNAKIPFYVAKIRRKPAWMPKENEPVFVEVNGKATIGVWGTGYVRVGNDPGLRFSEVKPYDPTKVGKPWDEV